MTPELRKVLTDWLAWVRSKIAETAGAVDLTPVEPDKVTVWLEDDDTHVLVAGPFNTIEQAEEWLATHPSVDPDFLAAGNYTIDYPEEMDRR